MFPLKLEDFSQPLPAPESGPDAAEASRLEGFETGYQAGWADADAARDQAEEARRAALAEALGALQLSYRQARSDVLAALSPLVSDLVARCLPEISRAALPQLVAEALAPWAEAGVSGNVVLNCHPKDAEILGDLTRTTPDLELRPDPNLPEGQIWMGSVAGELRIDISAALAEVSRNIDDFFALTKQENAHG